MVPISENEPEYPREKDETQGSNETRSHIIQAMQESKPFDAGASHGLSAHIGSYPPVQECFLDSKSTIRIPPLQYYEGRPSGFPDNILGSYGLLDLPEDICFDRYGRLGPYGHGYGARLGGLGTGQSGDMEGSKAVWNTVFQVDYRQVDWADVQGRCYDANAMRFNSASPFSTSTFSPSLGDDQVRVEARDDDISNNALPLISESENSTSAVWRENEISRTAVVVRTWDNYDYKEDDILHLRALITELSLGSGGEYDVHLLVQAKNETVPIWSDEESYESHLRRSVPREFWGIATLWSESQQQMLYNGLSGLDTFPKGPDLPVHGVYRGLMQALQYFAHNHPEYDFFWNWEMDVRYTGHFYDLFSKIEKWSKEQPRKGLWERNSRFYIPAEHGTWEDFKHMVRVQTEIGAESPNNIWSSLNDPKQTAKGPTPDKPIWGPERPLDPSDWFEVENDPVPPISYAKDKYEWGVDEDADLITLNPIFDPEGTTWGLAKDVTGYNTTRGFPPRRAAITTTSRISRRLLSTMHRETALARHHAFPETWPATTALHHGYKAVFAPHPMFIDREWPVSYLAATMNAGHNGATGGARTSVFGDREHNMLGTTWYYNALFSGNLWRRWVGLKSDNEGGEQFEIQGKGRQAEGKNGIPGMKGGEGRMCLPPMLLHPVKKVELPVESIHLEDLDVPETDPSA